MSYGQIVPSRKITNVMSWMSTTPLPRGETGDGASPAKRPRQRGRRRVSGDDCPASRRDSRRRRAVQSAATNPPERPCRGPRSWLPFTWRARTIDAALPHLLELSRTEEHDPQSRRRHRGDPRPRRPIGRGPILVYAGRLCRSVRRRRTRVAGGGLHALGRHSLRRRRIRACSARSHRRTSAISKTRRSLTTVSATPPPPLASLSRPSDSIPTHRWPVSATRKRAESAASARCTMVAPADG